jgi:hypothetical protein
MIIKNVDTKGKRYADITHLFGERLVTINGHMAVDLHAANKQKHEGRGRAKCVTFHWLATDWDCAYDDYDYVIVFCSKTRKVYVLKCVKSGDKPQHCWGRNSNTIAIGLAGMHGASGPNALGRYAIQDEQLWIAAQLAGEICAMKGIDPHQLVEMPELKCNRAQTVISPTGKTIMVPAINDHALFAKHDGYGNARWDCTPYIAKLRKDATRVYDELKGASKGVKKLGTDDARSFEFAEIL